VPTLRQDQEDGVTVQWTKPKPVATKSRKVARYVRAYRRYAALRSAQQRREQELERALQQAAALWKHLTESEWAEARRRLRKMSKDSA
jgi:hypothetical protein